MKSAELGCSAGNIIDFLETYIAGIAKKVIQTINVAGSSNTENVFKQSRTSCKNVW